jgi:hypothetical protein
MYGGETGIGEFGQPMETGDGLMPEFGCGCS